MAFFTIQAALLVSKNQQWLGLYSTNKILFISISIIFCTCLIFLLKKYKFPLSIHNLWNQFANNINYIFLFTSIVTSLPFWSIGVTVGEDISNQVKSSLEWANGTVNAPNIISQPIPTDLSQDEYNWNLRPPGASLLPIFGLMLGFSLGTSIKLGLFICSLIGSIGWIIVFKKFGISKYVILLISILLGVKTGTSINHYSTANIILIPIVPWIWILVSNTLLKTNCSKIRIKDFILFAIVFLLLGSFAWIKLSGIIIAGTIGAFYITYLAIKLFKNNKKFSLTLFSFLSVLFWVPFLFLEKINNDFTGITANSLYENIVVHEIEDELFGKNWCSSTQNFSLLWSFIASPGYALPANIIAHMVRDFGLQFNNFCNFVHQTHMNIHVLLCGFIGFFCTLVILSDTKKCMHNLPFHLKISLICFLTIPFIGLAILSYKFEWNYLLYFAHTSEYWLMLAVPTFIVFSSKSKINIFSFLLFGIIIALPLGKALHFSIFKLSEKDAYISKTEMERGLSPSRFSNAINLVENDSSSSDDIIYFLTSGDMADYTLRTNMRTMSTHFANRSIIESRKFKNKGSLHVYCVFDSELNNDSNSFLNSLLSKFPTPLNKKILMQDKTTVIKLRVSSSV